MNREKVKEVAVGLIKQNGLINLSRRELCNVAGIPDGSFPHVMGCNFSEFVRELQEEGIESSMAPVNKTRTSAVLRKNNILEVAIELSKSIGYHKVTRDLVAEAAGISHSLVSKYFGTMKQLRNEIMRAAIKREILVIIAQGLANNDDRAMKVPESLKYDAAMAITGGC